MQNSLGTHIILDLYGCDPESLKHVSDVQAVMREASRLGDFTIVTEEYHQFEPHGVSGATIIQESHLTLHSWPEHRYAALEIFYCGENRNVDTAIAYLTSAFGASQVERHDIARGIPSKYQSFVNT